MSYHPVSYRARATQRMTNGMRLPQIEGERRPSWVDGDGLRSEGTQRPSSSSSTVAPSASARMTRVVSRGSTSPSSILPISVRCNLVSSDSRSCEVGGSRLSRNRRTLLPKPARYLLSSSLYVSNVLTSQHSTARLLADPQVSASGLADDDLHRCGGRDPRFITGLRPPPAQVTRAPSPNSGKPRPERQATSRSFCASASDCSFFSD